MGFGAGVFGEVKAAASVEDAFIEAVKEGPMPRLMGKSKLSMNPGCGHDSGARLPSPIRLNTLRNERCPE